MSTRRGSGIARVADRGSWSDDPGSHNNKSNNRHEPIHKGQKKPSRRGIMDQPSPRRRQARQPDVDHASAYHDRNYARQNRTPSDQAYENNEEYDDVHHDRTNRDPKEQEVTRSDQPNDATSPPSASLTLSFEDYNNQYDLSHGYEDEDDDDTPSDAKTHRRGASSVRTTFIEHAEARRVAPPPPPPPLFDAYASSSFEAAPIIAETSPPHLPSSALPYHHHYYHTYQYNHNLQSNQHHSYHHLSPSYSTSYYAHRPAPGSLPYIASSSPLGQGVTLGYLPPPPLPPLLVSHSPLYHHHHQYPASGLSEAAAIVGGHHHHWSAPPPPRATTPSRVMAAPSPLTICGPSPSAGGSTSCAAYQPSPTVPPPPLMPPYGYSVHAPQQTQQQQQQPQPPAECIVDIMPQDVLSGRGGATNSHSGNRAFRLLVKQHQEEYLRAKKSDKPAVAGRIVELIRKKGGRFLRRCEGLKLPSTTSHHNYPYYGQHHHHQNHHASPSLEYGHQVVWVDIGDERAREKTCQALREGAPELRRRRQNSPAFSEQEAMLEASSTTGNETSTTPKMDNTAHRDSASSSSNVGSNESHSSVHTNVVASTPPQNGATTSLSHHVPAYPSSSDQTPMMGSLEHKTIKPASWSKRTTAGTRTEGNDDEDDSDFEDPQDEDRTNGPMSIRPLARLLPMRGTAIRARRNLLAFQQHEPIMVDQLSPQDRELYLRDFLPPCPPIRVKHRSATVGSTMPNEHDQDVGTDGTGTNAAWSMVAV